MIDYSAEYRSRVDNALQKNREIQDSVKYKEEITTTSNSENNEDIDLNNFINVEDYYATSYGITPIIDSLSDASFMKNTPVWDTTIININTLIRNNNRSDTSEKSVIEKTLKDMKNLISAIGVYYNKATVPPRNPYAILYIPNYNALPSLYQKKQNSSTARIISISNEISKRYDLTSSINKLEKTVYQGLPCYSVIVGNQREYPHKQLESIINKLNSEYSKFGDTAKKLFVHGDRRYILISHNPIDFHLCFKFQRMWLMESYTGAIREKTTFGEKVFKVPFVPFNKYTHLLFGDSIQIRAIAKYQNKKRFIELAKTQRWKTKSTSGILDDIVKTNQVPRDILTHPNF